MLTKYFVIREKTNGLDYCVFRKYYQETPRKVKFRITEPRPDQNRITYLTPECCLAVYFKLISRTTTGADVK